MRKELFEEKRIDALNFVVSDSSKRLSASLTKRESNNAKKRLEIAQKYLKDYKENGFWNNHNTWMYENIYADLPDCTSVSAW